jgi:hypothetical protein
MGVRKKLIGCFILFCLALALVLVPPRAASRSPQAMLGMQHDGLDETVPAYHTQVPQGALPATMSPALFPDLLVANSYSIAGRIKKTLYQMPCYCHCDRSQGHGSLLDCFANRHGAGCNICILEDLYAYEQSRKGKTSAQIRAGIIRGDWQHVDVAKYQSALLPSAKQ